MNHFNNGVNLGGWLSQYPAYNHEHFRSFITARDIEQIASWGMDHVRLPVDYPVLESDDAPGAYREDGFAYIDACLDWCQANGLGLVLDLHHAPGYTFTNTLQPETQHLNVLFNQESAQARFISLWQAIANRYLHSSIPLVLELLNEVVLPESSPWNSLAHKTVAAIREIDPVRLIMVGGNHYNAASELKNIELFEDPGVCYTFHFYEPLLFTHQKAPWNRINKEYLQTLEYPGSFIGLAEFLSRNPQWSSDYSWQAHLPLDLGLLLEFLRPAIDFTAQTGRQLYCGEFGVISGAPMISRQVWHADLINTLREVHIGRAVWSYKEMDFGLVNMDGNVIDPALVKIVSRP